MQLCRSSLPIFLYVSLMVVRSHNYLVYKHMQLNTNITGGGHVYLRTRSKLFKNGGGSLSVQLIALVSCVFVYV